MLGQALRRPRPKQSLTIDAGPHKQQPTDGPAAASGIADFEPIHQRDVPVPRRLHRGAQKFLVAWCRAGGTFRAYRNMTARMPRFGSAPRPSSTGNATPPHNPGDPEVALRPLLSAEDVAQILGITRETLQDWHVTAARDDHVGPSASLISGELRSSNCANWLRNGVTPKDAGSGLVPGQCASPAHDRGNLGLGGRCVLVSRQWPGKTLTERRADRRDVVAQVLAAAGITPSDADRLAADHTMPDGTPRFAWEDSDPDEVTYVAVIAASLRQAQAWRTRYEHAKTVATQRGSATCGHQFGIEHSGLRQGGAGDGTSRADDDRGGR